MKVVNSVASLVLVFLVVAVNAGTAKAFDSFFDVFTELAVNGQLDYQSSSTTSFDTIPTEMVALSLTSSSSPNTTVTLLPTGDYQIDSFFDVTYQVGPPGGSFIVDSFFDVFTEILVSPPKINPDGSHTFPTEMLSMDLAAAGGPPTSELILGLAEADHRGHVTVLKSPAPGGGGEGFRVDSFFDVFTELSVDGGSSFHPATGSTRVDFSITGIVPEPGTAILLTVGLACLVGFRRR